jgi:hypothetical protein
MAKPAKSIPTRSVRLLDGPPKKSLASLGVRTPPPGEEEADAPPAGSRTVERVVNGVKIESGIPMPGGRGGPPRLTPVLQALALHESFLIPGAKSAHQVYAAKKLVPGKKFICHNVTGGVRCWRIE